MTAAVGETEQPVLSLVERRRFPRLKAGFPVEFRPLTKLRDGAVWALSADLSGGGIRLTANRFLARDSRHVLLFRLLGDAREFRMVARVSWVRERPCGEFFDFGLEFVEISSEDRDAVAGLVERGAVLP